MTKKSSALALEIVSLKCNALVIMHWFFKKSNAIVKVFALESNMSGYHPESFI